MTKLLKRKYGLTFSKGKGRTKTERLRGTEKTKYEICHAVGTGFPNQKRALLCGNFVKIGFQCRERATTDNQQPGTSNPDRTAKTRDSF